MPHNLTYTTAEKIIALGSDVNLSQEECQFIARAAASRTYYSGFYFCENFHKSFNLGPQNNVAKNMGVHQKLIHDLLNPHIEDKNTAQKSKTIGKLLQQAKSLRTKADYKISKNDVFEYVDFHTIKSLIDQILESNR